MLKTLHTMALLAALLTGLPALAEGETDGNGNGKLPGTEEAPGYRDFEDADLSPQEVEEQEERREDRNVISPSMQDGEPLPGMDADSDE